MDRNRRVQPEAPQQDLGCCERKSPAEVTTVAESLEEALSVLQASGAEARCQLLDTSLIVALASPSAAQLWACVTEAILEGQAGVESAASILNQVVTIASPAASAIFTLAALEL